MKIAFHYMGSDEWTAGRTVMEMLIQAVRSLKDPGLKTALTVWDNMMENEYAEIAPLFDEIIQLPAMGHEASNLTKCLKEHEIDCFFSLPTESALRVNLPRITWIYDFQHIHFPANFSTEELFRRISMFSQHACSASRILTYSGAVKKDFDSLYPEYKKKLSVIRFVPHLPPELFDTAKTDVLVTYNIPSDFFLLPNQIHPHKNHILVLGALSLLGSRHCRPHIVCTGHTKNDLFRHICTEAQRMGVENQLHWLGVIPRNDYFGLLKASTAVINPSLFEGFGLGVAEAAAIGKKLLLSDINVFHEHRPAKADFFDPQNAAELADKIEKTCNSRNIPRHIEPATASYARYSTKQKKFGKDFIKVVNQAIKAGLVDQKTV